MRRQRRSSAATARSSARSCPSGGRCRARSSCSSSSGRAGSSTASRPRAGARRSTCRSRSSACRPETVVVDRGDVERAKPEPDLFLACQERLGVAIADCYVVGDAVWDLLAARRAGMLSVGLLTGGYGEDELGAAGAFRVYRDAAELLDRSTSSGSSSPAERENTSPSPGGRSSGTSRLDRPGGRLAGPPPPGEPGNGGGPAPGGKIRGGGARRPGGALARAGAAEVGEGEVLPSQCGTGSGQCGGGGCREADREHGHRAGEIGRAVEPPGDPTRAARHPPR